MQYYEYANAIDHLSENNIETILNKPFSLE